MKYRVISKFKVYEFTSYSEAMLFKHSTEDGLMYEQVNWKNK